MKKYFLLFPVFLLLFVPILAQAVTTSGTAAGVNEMVQWSISGIPDNQIYFSRSETNSSSETFYYIAPLSKGATYTVHAEIQHPTPLTGNASNHRELSISIPHDGSRLVAEKECSWSFSPADPVNTCNPGFVTLDHRAQLKPYQAIPAYPSQYQADKWISIKDNVFIYSIIPDPNNPGGTTGQGGLKQLYIYIIPQELIGLSNSEENGLPKHARTEPDFKLKKPYGCNSCSAIGLPGYRVNMFNLRPVVQDPLFQWSGRGPSVDLKLTWNAALAPGHTDFGAGWRFSYDAWLEEKSTGVRIYQGDGGELQFDIPPSANANVISVTTGTRDTTVLMEYSAPVDEPNYSPGWDGTFMANSDGYQLKKNLDGDPNMNTFILSPPDEKLSYIFQGPAGTSDLLPLIAIEDWNGNRMEITRNAAGAVTQITDAVNRKVFLTYNSAGQCTAITVPGGGLLHFSYFGTDLIRTVDLIGNTTSYTYNNDRYMTSMITEGRPWLFAWSSFNNHDYVSSITDPQGAVTSYIIQTLIQDMYVTKVTDPTGRSFTYDYPSGHYQQSTRPLSTRISSDSKGRPVEIYQHNHNQNMNSTYLKLEYDDKGNITKVNKYQGLTNTLVGVQTYIYNNRSQVTQYVDALNHTWIYNYDGHGNTTSIQTPAGRIFQYAYNATGALVQETDPEGNIRQYTYDGYGNVKTVTDAEGSVTTYLYDNQGINLIGITDPLGHTTSFTYDANRRLLRTTHPDGTYKERQYDCCAQAGLRNENGDYRTVTRDPSLRVTRETDFLGNSTVNTYDAAGRMISSRDPQGRTIRTLYNESGLPTSMISPTGNSVDWSYEARGMLRSQQLCQDPPAEADLDYSAFGVPVNANGWKYIRDHMGRLVQVGTPRDYWKYINYNRDADGLLTSIDIDGTMVATFSRDNNGLLSSTTHALGTDSYIRNGRGQVTQQTWYDGKTVVFGYDGGGRVQSIIYPDGSPALYNYDVRGRITNITWKGITFGTQYDAVGFPVKETRSNGIATDITNDKNGLSVRMHHYSGTRNYLDLQGRRNAGSLLTRIQKSGNLLDWIPQLTPDAISSSFTYGHAFTLADRNGIAATTDAAGNQTAIPGSRSFSGSYNYLDLLTDWTTTGSSNTVIYDGRRKLLQWSRNGEIRKFHYDEYGRLLFETDSTNTVKASWLYRENQVVAMADSHGVYFYHNDLSGNVAFLSDTSGTIVARYQYLPFGSQVNSTATVNNPFTFVGSFGVIDLHDDLYYMGSRTYDATLRAFLSNDPIGMGVTVNAREYAADNPINLIDPDGRSGMPFDYSLDGVPKPVRDPEMQGDHFHSTTDYSWNINTGVDPCKIENTIWNTAGSNPHYGKGANVLHILNSLRQGNYGDAIYEVPGVLLGFMKHSGAGPAGAGITFMGANPAGLPPDEEAERIRKDKEDPNSYYNRHSRNKPSFGDFTLPPFSLDD